ncbi:MAG: hypothetical protein AAF517_17420 [Planctomycetota bacterium]
MTFRVFTAVLPLLALVSEPRALSGQEFLRGDVDGNGVLELTDPINTLNFLFTGAAQPVCIDASDANDSGTVDLTDAVYGLLFLFSGGDAPPAPFPVCGVDPTPDGLDCLGAISTCSSEDLEQRLREVRANNVVIAGGRAYAACGATGLAVIDLATGRVESTPPPIGTDSVDDLSVADGFIFLLDARRPGFLSVLGSDRIDDGAIGEPVPVPVGPFAGVSAANSRVVVSGGTSELTVREYDAEGRLGSQVSTADLGVGQPDVLLADDAATALVSTDFASPTPGVRFGVTVIALDDPPVDPSTVHRIGLPGAGFSGGGRSPANFPIESARFGDQFVVAHGGGLSVVDPVGGEVVRSTDLGFGAVSVDVVDDRAFAVGLAFEPTLVEVDLRTMNVVDTLRFASLDSVTGVAADEEVVVVAANDGGTLLLRRE